MTEIQLDDQAIFEMARHIHSPDARQTYLQQACGTNLELHRQVTALLNAFENNHDFLECPPWNWSPPAPEWTRRARWQLPLSNSRAPGSVTSSS